MSQCGSQHLLVRDTFQYAATVDFIIVSINRRLIHINYLSASRTLTSNSVFFKDQPILGPLWVSPSEMRNVFRGVESITKIDASFSFLSILFFVDGDGAVHAIMHCLSKT